MTTESLALLVLAIFLVALLYSTVGHAGASGYVAALTLFGVAPGDVKPIALSLNLLVASLAAWQFGRAGHFRWALFWPFALLSVPMAYVGGALALPGRTFEILVGLVLLGSAAQLWMRRPSVGAKESSPPRPVALMLGGAIGLVSGLTGTGGGVLLTPVLLSRHWASARTAGAVGAMFILLNSSAALLGHLGSTRRFPLPAWLLLAAAAAGGAVGSYLGSRRLPRAAIERLLAVVLVVAGVRLLFFAR